MDNKKAEREKRESITKGVDIMKVIAELKEFPYNGDVKVLTVENYIHANMVKLSLDGKTINVDSRQLIEAVKRCSLGYLEG